MPRPTAGQRERQVLVGGYQSLPDAVQEEIPGVFQVHPRGLNALGGTDGGLAAWSPSGDADWTKPWFAVGGLSLEIAARDLLEEVLEESIGELESEDGGVVEMVGGAQAVAGGASAEASFYLRSMAKKVWLGRGALAPCNV